MGSSSFLRFLDAASVLAVLTVMPGAGVISASVLSATANFLARPTGVPSEDAASSKPSRQ